MNRNNMSKDENLEKALCSLRKIQVPSNVVTELYRRIEKERESKTRVGLFILDTLRRKKQIIIAVFATLLFAVPVTYYLTRQSTRIKAAKRTFVVQFIYENKHAEEVHLIGDFNNWSKQGAQMQKIEDTHYWTVQVPLNEGIYKYVFLVDDEKWAIDPLSQIRVTDNFGIESSLIVLMDTYKENFEL
jgi:hypothetical protein